MQRLTLFLIALFALPTVGFVVHVPSYDRVEVVIIDAGHGGKAPGNLGTRRYKTVEKDIALDVALLTAEAIRQAHPDVKVILTRDDDSFLELHERTALANRSKADVFISIHCNAWTSQSAYGTETFVMGKNHDDENQVALMENSDILMEDNIEANYDGFDPRKPESYIALTLFQYAFQRQSIELAQNIQQAFREDVGRHDRGVRQQPLYVTSRTSMPSVLVELGFLTNAEEEDYLNTTKGKSDMANAIAGAFSSYKTKRESVGQQPSKSSKDKSSDQAKPVVIKPVAQHAFYVQLAVSGLKKALNEPPFENAQPIKVMADGRLYRYLHGPFSTWDVAKSAQDDMRSKGFPDAFLVGYLGSEKVPLSEVKKALQSL